MLVLLYSCKSKDRFDIIIDKEIEYSYIDSTPTNVWNNYKDIFFRFKDSTFIWIAIRANSSPSDFLNTDRFRNELWYDEILLYSNITGSENFYVSKEQIDKLLKHYININIENFKEPIFIIDETYITSLSSKWFE